MSSEPIRPVRRQRARIATILPRMLDAETAAHYCGVARETIYRLEGFPRPVPLGEGVHAAVRWDIDDLDAWLDARKAAGALPSEEQPGLTRAEVAEQARSMVAKARRARRGA